MPARQAVGYQLAPCRLTVFVSVSGSSLPYGANVSNYLSNGAFSSGFPKLSFGVLIFDAKKIAYNKGLLNAPRNSVTGGLSSRMSAAVSCL